MSGSLKPMTHFELLNASLGSALREHSLISSIQADMQDLTQGGCLLVAASLMQQSFHAMNNGVLKDWFPESQIAVVTHNGQAQHFATQFNLHGKQLFADGYGVNNKAALLGSVAGDMQGVSAKELNVTPVTFKRACELAEESGIPIPSESVRTLFAKTINHELANTPAYAIYMRSDSVRLNMPKGPVFSNAGEPMRLIRQDINDALSEGIPPFQQDGQYLLVVGCETPKALSPVSEHDGIGKCFDVTDKAQCKILGCYHVSPSGDLSKMTRPDMECALSESLDDAFYDAPARAMN